MTRLTDDDYDAARVRESLRAVLRARLLPRTYEQLREIDELMMAQDGYGERRTEEHW